ncbi:ParA family protein [Streptomyces actinomycinicus]|uniref:ParA family protein n=1 Tax=Streptomyces actinomycinicus TaxID=1695166 RepID=A0A937JQJ1_9ACTN|nr:ParA family protein [Streptomyces actinomycinicus]MBL1086755.1 ParA family protein [Streptomyces actinomycinicus]
MLSDAVDAVEPHENAVMIGTGKGGVGKSTIAAHKAAWHAAQGQRTLLICVTSQDDDDLGIERYDRGLRPDGASVLKGEGLYRAIHDRTALLPVREVRPNLDVVPGGPAVGELLTLLTARMPIEGIHVVASLHRAIAPIAPWYDRIVIDSAPEQDPLEQLALTAARWLFVPTRSDDSSIGGMRRIARNYKLVRSQINPHLQVAGACLYGSNPSATQLHEEVRRDVIEVLGASTPMLSTVVGYREMPAVNARKKGLTFREYADLLPTSAKSYDVAAGRAARADVVPESIKPLAKEMDELNVEIDSYCRRNA